MPEVKDLAIVRRFLDFPIRKKLYLLVGILTVDLAVVIAVGVLGMWVLSSLRAYVGGEGLWAKAQKNAVYSLGRYALSGEEEEYRAYQSFLGVCLGDKKARQELEKPVPDFGVSDAGFIAGGNHPDDVRAMALLFRRFHRVDYIARATSIWGEADDVLTELEGEADDLHRGIASGSLSRAEVRRRLERIDAINARLTRLENGFSSTLGEASRWAKRVLFWAMAVAALLFGGLGLLAALLIGGSVADAIAALSAAAARAERGDLKVRVEIRTRDELGLLAEAFNRMAEGLGKLDEMKNDFLATASHELRTPLALAMAPLESLLAGDAGDLTVEQRRLLEVMHNNVVRQLQLVAGLLDFSRLEAGKVEIAREPVDVAVLTRTIVDDFRPLARSKGLRLETLGIQATPTVLIDRYLYERIVFNLLSNAVKFTARDGSVAVALAQSGDRLRLTVRDTGIGIAPADHARLFRKFRQLDSSSTRRFEGTGLGLALVREFAALLGGDVSVRSELGKGSEFVAEIAAAPCAAEGGARSSSSSRALAPRYGREAAPPAASDGPGGILIAEDNRELASYLGRLLEGLGSIHLAGDGQEALHLARERRPDLVLADVMMPGLDGLGLCRALKSNPSTSAIPVVLLTALTDRASLNRGWKAGADEYLFKPFHPKEIITRIRSMLESARARRRAEETLARKSRELEASNRELSCANDELQSFNYSVAHDLRAPLVNLTAFCAQLEKVLPPEEAAPQCRDLLRRLQGGVERMNSILLGLLQLSHVGRQELSYSEIDLSEAARGVAAELVRAEPGRAVEFAAAPGLRARGDGPLLRVVLRRLLENAWKFTALHPRARVEFGVVRREGETAYFVRDDGAGFDMASAGRLFAAFQRLHSAKDFPGTGMGLAIARRVVERHGGRLWAEAGVERGAAFYFTLEAGAAAAARQ